MDVVHDLFFSVPLRFERVALAFEVGEFLLQRFESFLARIILFLFERLTLDFELRDAAFELFQFLRHGLHLRAELGGGLVHEVNRLVRQETVGDVPMRKLRGGNQRGVLDADLVMQFVALAKSAQDGDGVLDAWLVDHHRLEAAFERGILLNVFAVLVERGRADAVQLAAGEHGLEHVAGVHRALSFARADHRVNFVNEEDNLTLRLRDFLENSFEALLEFAAILRAGNERAEVQPHQPFVFQAVRHVTGDDAPSETFDDGGLAHTRLADEHGVVLRATREHLDAAPDFGIAANHRVQFVLRGELGEVAAVFFQRFVSGFGIGARDALVAAHFGQRLEELVPANAEVLENLADARAGGFIEHRQHHVFNGDVFILELLRLVLSGHEKFVEPLGDIDSLTGHVAAGDARDAVEFLLDLGFEEVGRDFGLLE